MIDQGKKNILGILIDAIDYEAALKRIIDAAKEGRPYGVSAFAVHSVMMGTLDKMHALRVNALDLIVPDGQPLRWALNLLYKCGLQDRVYGPNLMLRICEASAKEGLPVFLYGS